MVKNWSIGIDPGFGETGLVLVQHGFDSKDRYVKEWAVLSCPPDGTNYNRAVQLADKIATTILKWIDRYAISSLDIGIEVPIWSAKKSNPHSFELQWRLVQELESALGMLIALNNRGWITEVYPSTSKMLATKNGKATKDEIFEASPFRHIKSKDLNPVRLTVADAWAHSLATWGSASESTRFRMDAFLDHNLAKIVAKGTINSGELDD